ncbi:MAG: hypothetical protein VB108_04140 [Anaerolineaceae bacterium]|nr:hypothetical protein [Anaerolineaceae bacterium]
MKTEKENMASQDFPIRLLNRFQDYPWMILITAGIVFGLLGYMAGFLLKPVYEARAVLTTNMDIKEERPFITEIMVDSQIQHIGELMYNPAIVQTLLEKENAQGNHLSLEELRDNSSVERQLMNTYLKVRGNDPAAAARIASEWAEIAFQKLQEAKVHALKAGEARRQLAMLNVCFPLQSKDEEIREDPAVEVIHFCKGLDLKEAEKQVKSATQILLEEDAHTLGLSPSLNVSQFVPASIPSKPLRFNQGALSLAGSLFGLVFGIILIEIASKKQPS